jgi:hypothetical protein
MKSTFLLSFMIILSIFSCDNKENPMLTCSDCITCKEGDGVGSPQCVWRSNSSDRLAKTTKPLIYNDILIISKGALGEAEVIQFFNKNTGEKLGEWSDYEKGAPSTISNRSLYVNDGTLVVCTGTRLYGIDLVSFKTIWESRSGTNGGDANIYGVFDKTYHATYGTTEFTMTIYEGAVKTGKYRPIITFNVPDTTKLDLVFVNAFVKGTDTLALICTNNYFYNSNGFKAYFTLLNITKNLKVYEKDVNEDIMRIKS